VAEIATQRIYPYLSASTRAVTFSMRRRAATRFSQLAVRPDTGLGVDAPEQAFIRMRDGWVGLGEYELSLPAQGWTEVWMIGVEAIGLRDR
jgi:hypothetical protein